MSLMGASWSDCLRSWIVSGAGFWFQWVHAWGWLRCSVGVCWGLLWCLVAGLWFVMGDWLRGLRGSVFHWVFHGCLIAHPFQCVTQEGKGALKLGQAASGICEDLLEVLKEFPIACRIVLCLWVPQKVIHFLHGVEEGVVGFAHVVAFVVVGGVVFIIGCGVGHGGFRAG
jgi:hypothetical protein